MRTDQEKTIDRLLRAAQTADEAGDAPRAKKMASAAEQLRKYGGSDLESAARAILVSGSAVSEKSTEERLQDAVAKLLADRQR